MRRWISGALGCALTLMAARAQTRAGSLPQPEPPRQADGLVRPGVEIIPTVRFPARTQARPERKTSFRFTVPANGWMDTGLDVFAGEKATVSATGDVTLGDGRVVGPDGVARGWKDLLRHYPLDSANAGTLVARVTDAAATVPFALGAAGSVAMPTSGRLFLAVNQPTENHGSGQFAVTLHFVPGTPAATAVVDDLRFLLSPDLFGSIPKRVADAAGDPGDTINFALVGSETQIVAAFASAGWVAVDRDVSAAVLHGLLATLNHEAYTAMPMSTLFLFGRGQDLSFARGEALEVAAVRHHLRLWQTTQSVSGRPLWVGSATRDIGFERDVRGKANGTGGVTHRIDPDVDAERTFLLQSFDAAGAFRAAAYVTPVDAFTGEARTASGGTFHTDGRVLVMALP